jgi:hypothetical protein
MSRYWQLMTAFFVVLIAVPLWAAEPGIQSQPKRMGKKDAQYLWVFKESVALGVPEDELAHLVEHCRAQGFASSEIRRMLALIAKAKLAGLPHGDLLLKLREGLAKNASPELVDAALADKAQKLRKAKSVVDTLLMSGYATEDYALAIKIVADTLEMGLTPQNILSVVRSGKPTEEGIPDPARIFKYVAPTE